MSVAIPIRRGRADDAATFVDSTNPRNVPFYERFGFWGLVDPVRTGSAPGILPMWRPAPPIAR